MHLIVRPAARIVRLERSLSGKASWKTLVLEVFMLTFGECLVVNARLKTEYRSFCDHQKEMLWAFAMARGCGKLAAL